MSPEGNTDSRSDLAIARRLLEMARPYWRHIAGILVLNLLATPIALLGPVPLKIAVDSVIGSDPLPGFLEAVTPAVLTATQGATLLYAVGLLLLIALLRQGQSLGSWVLQTYTGQKLILRFRTRLFRHSHRLSLTYHDREGSADSLYRIQYDAPSIRQLLIDGVIPLVGAVLTVIAMLYVTFRIDLQLALVALAVVPALFFVTRSYRPKLREQWKDVKEKESSALSVVQEVLSSLRVVKAFGQEEREKERFYDRSSESVWANVRVVVAESKFSLIMGLTTAAGTAGVLYLGVQHVLAGVLSLGELLIIMSYLSQLYDPLKTIGTKVANLQNALASADRAFRLLDQSPEVAERPDARPLDRAGGQVTFDGVSFGYEEGEPVLEEVSFQVPAGARVGLVGRTGAGKTTLVHLLIRLHDPDEGAVRLDGIDLREYRLADLRDQFAMVLQEPVLFSTSIGENIAYARAGASREEIEAAARAANIHEFIEGLPNGYETAVGERGMRLSGGERQRVSLARAFLKDAPILVLDEPTSSVDVETEAGIMEAMERLMEDRTTFMISHRVSTLRDCDLLLAVEGARVQPLTGDIAREIREIEARGEMDRTGPWIRHVDRRLRESGG